MTVMQTGALQMPPVLAKKLITDVKTKSTVAALAAKEPKLFGADEKYIQFTSKPRAQFVEEGQAKVSSTPALGSFQSATHVAQVTMRTSNQVKWADEDYKLGIFTELAALGAEAIARALDLGLYHRVNPLTGTVINGWTNWLTSSTNRVPIPSTNPGNDRLIEAAVGILIGTDVQPNAVAFTPDFAYALSTLRDTLGRKLYPELGYGLDISSFDGLKASSSTTVSGVPEVGDTGVRAIVGDYANGIFWGLAKDLPIETIEYGDPDGQGDLKAKNEVALRLEVAYTWYVRPERFAVIETGSED